MLFYATDAMSVHLACTLATAKQGTVCAFLPACQVHPHTPI